MSVVLRRCVTRVTFRVMHTHTHTQLNWTTNAFMSITCHQIKATLTRTKLKQKQYVWLLYYKRIYYISIVYLIFDFIHFCFPITLSKSFRYSKQMDNAVAIDGSASTSYYSNDLFNLLHWKISYGTLYPANLIITVCFLLSNRYIVFI